MKRKRIEDLDALAPESWEVAIGTITVHGAPRRSVVLIVRSPELVGGVANFVCTREFACELAKELIDGAAECAREVGL